MESTTEKKFLKKDADLWNDKLSLDKRNLKQGKYGMEYAQQYFPVKHQYESFAELQADIDNNLSPLELVQVSSFFYDENGDPIEGEFDTPLERYCIRGMHSSVLEFLQFFFTIYNAGCVTRDNKKRITCEEGKRRSFVDLYRICKFYYPTTSVKEVKEALWDLPFAIDVFICPDIKRRVHRRNDNESGSISYNDADEFGWDYYCTNVKDSKHFNTPYKKIVPIINKQLPKLHLNPKQLQFIDPNVIWFAGNNYNNAKPKDTEVKEVKESDSELPF